MTNQKVLQIASLWLILGVGADAQILHSFTAGADGGAPGGLVEVQPDLFLGVTGTTFTVSSEGSFVVGTLLNPNAVGGPVLGDFYPASNGLFYGSTLETQQGSTGTAFVTTASGTATVIATALSSPTSLVEASDGNFYGARLNVSTSLYEIFRMKATGAITTVGVLGAHQPAGALLQASDGNLYGAADPAANGAPGFVFRVTLAGQLSAIAQFPAGSGPAGAFESTGALVEGTNGILYGVANYGDVCPGDAGFTYAAALSGGLKILHAFAGCPIDSPVFTSGLTQASDGMLYGAYDDYMGGRIFRFGMDGSGLELVGPIQGGLGFDPGYGVIQGSDGALYITFQSGGQFNFGTVSRLDLSLPRPLPAPHSFSPAGGPPGTQVLIAGSHMIGLTNVTLNGVPAKSIISRGVDYAVAVVPAGATTGPVTVTTENGSGTSVRSFVVQ